MNNSNLTAAKLEALKTLPSRLNSTALCVGSICLNENDIQSIQTKTINSYVCDGTSCLNSTDVALIKALPTWVNSSRHCIGPDCMIPTDLTTLKSIPRIVNSSNLCAGTNCLNTTDLVYLKEIVANNTPPYVPYRELTVNSTVKTFATGVGDARGIAVADDGTVYVADYSGNRIRRVFRNGTVSVYAGNGTRGGVNGPALSSTFYYPQAVAVDRNGIVYVAEYFGYRIRRVYPNGMVDTMAGDGTSGSLDGNGTSAKLNTPSGLVIAPNGTIYFTESNSNYIRKITPDGMVSTIITSAYSPYGITLDNTSSIIFTEAQAHRVRKIVSPSSVVLVAGNGTSGFADGPAKTMAMFNQPGSVQVDYQGVVYIGEFMNKRVRKLTPDGLVSTIAGDGNGGYLDGIASSAKLDTVLAIALSSNGTLYFAENNRIRTIQNL